MPDFHQITPTVPTEVPATGARTYDAAWMTNFVIEAPDPRHPVRARVVLRRASRSTEDGQLDLLSVNHPDGDPVEVAIDNLLLAASQDIELAQLIDGILRKVDGLAKAAGLL